MRTSGATEVHCLRPGVAAIVEIAHDEVQLLLVRVGLSILVRGSEPMQKHIRKVLCFLPAVKHARSFQYLRFVQLISTW